MELSGTMQGIVGDLISGSVDGTINIEKGNIVINPLNITENGTYNAPSGVDGYNPINVQVPEAVIESLNITENGTYNAPSGVDGYNPINVNIVPSLKSEIITQNGIYLPPEDYDGFNRVEVNVSSDIILYANNVKICTSAGYYLPQQPLTVPLTEDGYYLISLYSQQEDDFWNTIIHYHLGDETISINYNRYFALHLTPTTIGTQEYGGNYIDGYIKMSKIDPRVIY